MAWRRQCRLAEGATGCRADARRGGCAYRRTHLAEGGSLAARTEEAMGVVRWFETRIDPFRETPDRDPPPRVLGFFWHYLRQVPIAGGALLALGAIGPILETLLFVALGRVVDTMAGTPAGAESWS